MSDSISPALAVPAPTLIGSGVKSVVPVDAYESRLRSDLEWAMNEGSRYFRGESGVQNALKKIAKRLDELEISYGVVGAMAMFLHGFERFTEDIDILVTRQDLTRIHEELAGRGYVRPFERSKNLRDTEFGVRIEFLIAGEYPGDGKPKPVAFPDPTSATVERNGVRIVDLPTLVNMKLASGMTSSHRRKDLVDVQQLIVELNLSKSLADDLNPYVKDQYLELWDEVLVSPIRYVSIYAHAPLESQPKSLDDLIAILGSESGELQSMHHRGVQLDPSKSTATSAYLVTSDRTIAATFGMVSEAEIL